MRVSIIPPDSLVIVDGVVRVCALDLPPNMHAVQWDGQAGHVEYTNRGSEPLADLSEFQAALDAWESAAPVPPPAPTLEEAKAAAIERVRSACRAYIYASYSPEKQANITADEAARATAPPPDPVTMYSHEAFLVMHAFKNEARVICNLACAEIESPETATVEAVNEIMEELEHLYGLDVPPGV